MYHNENINRPDNGPARRRENKPEFPIMARYGDLMYVGLFMTAVEDIHGGDKVILRTERGTEIGDALTSCMEYEDGDRARSVGRLLRKATSDDFRLKGEIEKVKIRNEKDFCKKKIVELELPMKLASVEHLFGGDKIIFYFLADGRVDFRQLVRELAREYRTRIEMKQIGVRDEAKLISDYEHCGRELCCRAFMKELLPVTMKMAKNQKATLDPAKISGACGRLMCCLRFEDDVYNELKKSLPRRGSKVTYRGRHSEVVDYDVIQLKVRVIVEGKEMTTVSVKELEGTAPAAFGDGMVELAGEEPPPEKNMFSVDNFHWKTYENDKDQESLTGGSESGEITDEPETADRPSGRRKRGRGRRKSGGSNLRGNHG